MQQRRLGCGGIPAYGPILRDAKNWNAYYRYYGHIIYIIEHGDGGGIGYNKNDAKRCGDFDNDTSLGVYICYICIKNQKKRQNFLS